MSQKKINWILSIIIIVTVFVAYTRLTTIYKINNFKWGKDYNKTRHSLGIPQIENDWIINELTTKLALWGEPDKILNTANPTHFYKEIHFLNGSITKEKDAFHYETKDSIAYRVICEYYYEDTLLSCRLITYFKGKYPPTQTINLTIAQADSILNNWGLAR